MKTKGDDIEIGDVVMYPGSTAEWEVLDFQEALSQVSRRPMGTFVSLKRADPFGRRKYPDFVQAVGCADTTFTKIRGGDVQPHNEWLWVATVVKYLAHNPTKSLYDFGVETERTQGDLARMKELMEQLGDETYKNHE